MRQSTILSAAIAGFAAIMIFSQCAGDPADTGGPEGAPVVVRGRWTLEMSSDEGSGGGGDGISMAATGNQGISGTVAAQVTFSLSNSNFTTPAASGVASYGTLDVTGLNDNDLRVCGVGGHSKCTVAGLRVYTTGTAGSGLWNTVEAYGLPILTGGDTIGLGSGSGVVLGTVSIPVNMRVVKLSDFTSQPRYEVPISVDFSDAAAGSYSSTLVLEYYLQ